MRTRFVLLAAGDDPELYPEAHGAALSLLAHAPPGSEILVFTTRPDRFRWLSPALRVEKISPGQLCAWRGRRDYFFRAKFEVIRRAAALGPGNLLFLDADTLVTGPLGPLLAALDRGDCVLHAPEQSLQDRKRTRDAFQHVFGQRLGGFVIERDTLVFNSGVIGIPGNRRDLVEQSLRCNDALLEAGVDYFAVEQVAWSAVLGSAGEVFVASPYVVHYWGNKRAFLKAIHRVLADALLAGWTPLEAAAQLASRPIDLPLRVKDRWWHRPLARLLRLPAP